MQTLQAIGLGVLLGAAFISSMPAQVPVRLSVKFILDSSGNRPATGGLNTDAEILNQVDDANQMFANHVSELRLQVVEITDIAGASAWYSAEPNFDNLDDLRDAAMDNPGRYRWRDDAVNVYITGAPGAQYSGYADFPPDNNIILLPQAVWDNTLAHEVGHILGLYHTHESTWGEDECDDTLADDKDWTRDDIAINNFSRRFADLTATEQSRVNLVWFNVMSYHNGDNAFLMTPCQMDRQSSTAYAARERFLSKTPVYVEAGIGGSHDGSFEDPFQTVQQAIDADSLAGRVMVLKQGVHPHPISILNGPTQVVTRSGPSGLQCQPVKYSLPHSLESSANPVVREAVRQVRNHDRTKNSAAALANLRQSERLASGGERIALQLELAQRLRDTGQRDEAAVFFTHVAAATDQPELRNHATSKADAMKRPNRAVDSHLPITPQPKKQP